MAFRAESYADGAVGNAAVTIGLPAGTVATDLLVAVIYGTINGGRPLTAAGWTFISADTASTFSAAYSFWAPGNVASTTFLSSNAGGTAISGRIAAFSGRSLTSPITSGIAETTAQTASTTTSAIASAAGDDVLVVWTDNNGATTVFGPVPSPLTAGAFNNVAMIGGPQLCSQSGYQNNVSAGTVGGYTIMYPNFYNPRSSLSFTLAASTAPVSDPSARPTSRFAATTRHSFGTRR